MKKKVVFAGLLAGLTVLSTIPAFAWETKKLEDGWIMKYASEETLNENSGYYDVYYYKWEQQADGTWKLHKKRDYWMPTCNHSFGHERDPRPRCPGEMVHEDEYVAGKTYEEYFLDSNGIMVADKWVPVADINRAKWSKPDDYDRATYWYFDADGKRRYDMVKDGVGMKDGVWRDPKVIAVNADGTFNMPAMSDEQFEHYLIEQYELTSMYTVDEIKAEINRRPSLKGNSVVERFNMFNDPVLLEEIHKLNSSK